MADSTKTAHYADHEDHFRDHFRENYKKGEGEVVYSDYEAGYRSGFRYGTSSEHQGRSFDDLEPEMRRRHEKEHGEGTWGKVKEAARHAFERGRSRSSPDHTGTRARDTKSHAATETRDRDGKRDKKSSSDFLDASGSSETASGDPGSAMREGGFDVHREAYQRHHEEHYAEGERDFSDRVPAYRHGHRFGASDEHAGRSYEDVRPEMRRRYEKEHGEGTWERDEEAARHAFGNARSSKKGSTKHRSERS